MKEIADEMAMMDDVFNAAIARIKTSQDEIDDKNEELRRQHANHLNFVTEASSASRTMASKIRELEQTLARERATRNEERRGYQQIWGCPNSRFLTSRILTGRQRPE